MRDTISIRIQGGHNQQIPARKHNASSLLMKGQGVPV